jgi:hypothetical protein
MTSLLVKRPLRILSWAFGTFDPNVGTLSQIKASLCTVGDIGTDKPDSAWLVIPPKTWPRFRRGFFYAADTQPHVKFFGG